VLGRQMRAETRFFGFPGARRAALVAAVGALALAAAGCLPATGGAGNGGGANHDPVRCGTKLTADLVLPNDLSCTGTALTTDVVGLHVDLNGHTIRYVGKASVTGVIGSAMSLSNGTISGFDTAFQDLGSNDPAHPPVTIDRVHFVGNKTGVFLSGDAVTLTNSAFDAEGVDSSTGILLGQKTATAADELAHNEFDNLTTGISIAQWSDTTIEHNHFVKNGTGVDASETASLEVADNDFDSGGTGVRVSQGNDDLTIRDNTAHDGLVGIWITNTAGFPLESSSDNVISGNTLTGNGASGLAVVADWAAFTGMQIDGNTANQNGSAPGSATNAPVGTAPLTDGIYVNVDPAGTVTVSNNHASANASHGIAASGVTDGGGNTASGNGAAQQCTGVACT